MTAIDDDGDSSDDDDVGLDGGVDGGIDNSDGDAHDVFAADPHEEARAAADAAAAAKRDADALASAAGAADDAELIREALRLRNQRAAKAEAMLVDALYTLGDEPDKVRARPLILACLELGTDDAVDAALNYTVCVDFRDEAISLKVWTSFFAGFVRRLPELEPKLAEAMLWNFVAPTIYRKSADEPMLAFLCAVVDDTRLSSLLRTSMAREIWNRVEPPPHLLATPPDLRARYLDALAARTKNDGISPQLMVAALFACDASQAYDELHERFRSDEEWRAEIANFIDEDADPRFVDEAVRIVSVDPQAATQTLGNMRSERAVDELVQWADTAASADGLDVLARAAIFQLQRMREPRAAPAILRWLERRDVSDAHDVNVLLESLEQTAAAQHVPLLYELAATSRHAARYVAIASRLRA